MYNLSISIDLIILLRLLYGPPIGRALPFNKMFSNVKIYELNKITVFWLLNDSYKCMVFKI